MHLRAPVGFPGTARAPRPAGEWMAVSRRARDGQAIWYTSQMGVWHPALEKRI